MARSWTASLHYCWAGATVNTPDHPREYLGQRMASWAKRLQVQPRQVRLRHMTRKWGSCSTKGIVTLDYELVERNQGFQDYVIVHELLHLRVSNHGKLFKSLMTMYVPDWKKLDLSRRRIHSISINKDEQ